MRTQRKRLFPLKNITSKIFFFLKQKQKKTKNKKKQYVEFKNSFHLDHLILFFSPLFYLFVVFFFFLFQVSHLIFCLFLFVCLFFFILTRPLFILRFIQAMFFGGDDDHEEEPEDEDDDQRDRRTRFGSRQPPKKPSKRAPLKPSRSDGPEDYDQTFDDLLDDVLGEESDSDSDSNRFSMFDRDKDKKEELSGDNTKPFLLFDFRRGPEKWPEGCTMVDYKTAEKQITQIKEEVANSNKTAKARGKDTKMDAKDDKEKDDPWAGALMMGSMESWGSDMEMMRTNWDRERDVGFAEEKKGVEPEVISTKAPEEAKYETLKDGSSALIVPAGTRLKLDLNALTTDKWKDAGKKKKKPKKSRWGGWGSRKWSAPLSFPLFPLFSLSSFWVFIALI